MVSRRFVYIILSLLVVFGSGAFFYSKAPLKALTVRILTNRTATTTISFNTEVNKLTDGLVSYWTFDGKDMNWTNASNTLDKTSNANNGATVSMATSSVASGAVGQALIFDGVNDHVLISDSASLRLSSWSISLWIYINKLPGSVRVTTLLDKGRSTVETAGNNANYGLSLDVGASGAGTNLSAVYEDSSGTNYTATWLNNDLTTNRWYHVVGTLDNPSNTLSLYVDGVQRAQNTSATGDPDTGPEPIEIGDDSDNVSSVGEFFNGRIDDVRLYDHAISSSTVKQLYETAKVTPNAPITYDFNNGLIHYWTFNGPDMDWSVGSSTFDMGSNNNDGQAISMSTTTSVVPGRVGQALRFVDDGSQHVRINYMNIGTTLTYAFWAKEDNANFGVTQDAFSYMRTLVRFTTNTVQFYSDTTQGAGTSDSWSEDRRWHFWAFTITGTSVRVYIDGRLLAATTLGFGVNTANGGINLNNIGRGNGSTYYGGTIDEFRVYNRVLSDDEIRTLYRMSRPLAH